jgi:hypothetical protein
MRILKRFDIIWYGWKDCLVWPWVIWGTWMPHLNMTTFKFLSIGPIQFRLWPKGVDDVRKR